MSKLIDRTGHRFGAVIALERRPTIRRGSGGAQWRVRYLCRCDCGVEFVCDGASLVDGNTKTCGGSAHRRKLPAGESAFRRAYRVYMRNASARGLMLAITLEHFRGIVSMPCHYCGVVGYSCVREETYGDFAYNGLDRIDNTLGYTLDNVVPCCMLCNRSKGEMSQADFFAWIKRVHGRL